MTTPWMIDELAHAGPEHLDEAFVAAFDRKQGFPDPGPDLAALRTHGVGPDATVLDLGAGTGRFALAAAGSFDRVIAVDISPAMAGVITRRARERSLANLAVVTAGFLGYRHQGPPVDAVHTRHALHQLPDFWKTQALERIAALLRPGGVLRLRDLIYDFAPAEAEDVFADWMARASRDPLLGYTAEDYAEHIRTEHSTYRWLLEPMLDAAGFDIVETQYEARLFGTYTCLRR
ncbi:methyltransferase domain-containing protein [Streptomyces sp. 3MP-14]|uniref:Methyltransferase domain-containing protein n=1 Tax=Streptomyces mimosae TaxID=2586635 RepID=A0A5N6A0D7_9ACTN|nr:MULTISPECIES: class I SAM-dependent methyltransferase [Streptomyces]KAB8161642.1 methyltransferase domain-containing protein [Streptomyces mimosae]KAB8173421.1 methyltransferase domain-containing protein [Streptomyces sp. 3MP-14]